MTDSNTSISASERAALATFSCARLVLLNYQLVAAGSPVKLYVDMSSEEDHDHFKKFLNLINNNHLLDLSPLEPFYKADK